MTSTRRLAPVIPPAVCRSLRRRQSTCGGRRAAVVGPGHITSSEAIRAYISALPITFAGIGVATELQEGVGRDRLHRNIRTAWAHRAPATFNTGRAAGAGALNCFRTQQWIGDAAVAWDGPGREHQPEPDAHRVSSRETIDRPIADKRWPRDAHRPTWTPGVDALVARLTTAVRPAAARW